MSKFNLLLFIMLIIFVRLFAELDFCDHTVLVTLEASISEFNASKDISFFGNFEKTSIVKTPYFAFM
ncbi:MAG: hypothetical protein FWG98_14015 [Candidatus Cloacimonetes bacterium]|nr:hypothetical protein [Candidatus Cloacimonadota bacterium]